MNRREFFPLIDASLSQGYRADIDGLRAVAVLAVVIFHAFPALAPGGFVGVDIFFVISGYLITRIISREIDAGTYSTLRFYERRFRRIAPAFLVVCAFSAVAAALLYTPDHFELFGESLVASVLIHANIFFLKESGYFAAPEDVMPLLHVWSLSVEEQFYVFFPIALVLLSRWRNLRLQGILVGMVVSFVAACFAVVSNPDAAFYLAPYRAWELLLGSLLAVNAFPTVHGRSADACSWAGAALLAFSIWGLSSSSMFPGWTAALPVIGAALLIYAGPQAALNRALSVRPMVGVGLISYSLYLWHWPLLSFGAYVAMRPLNLLETASVVALAFVGAWLSYRFVERPFRRPTNRVSLTPLFGGSAALLAVAVAAGMTDGASWRLPSDVAAMTSGEAVRVGMRPDRCVLPELAEADKRLTPLVDASDGVVCRLGSPTAQPTVVLWGDSHADAAAPALDEVLAQAGKAGYLFSRAGCPPVDGIDRLGLSSWRCADYTEAAINAISEIKPERVILMARWPHYFESSRNANERRAAPVFAAAEDNFTTVAVGLSNTLSEVSAAGRSLVLITSVPEVGFHVPSMLARAAILGREIEITPTRAAYDARQQRSTIEIARLAQKHGAKLLRPDVYFCVTDKCEIKRDSMILYADSNHLSQAGARLLVPIFEQALELPQ